MRVRIEAPLAALVVMAPASAFAVDYLSVDQAARMMFPQAERFEPRELQFDAAQMQALAKQGAAPRAPQMPVLAARRGERILGYVVVDDVVGKFERITYAVGITPQAAVAQVEILSYRESHGGEIRLPAWRNQFIGKDHAAPLRVGEDITNISGATLSCTHLTDGVRRIVAWMDAARQRGGL